MDRIRISHGIGFYEDSTQLNQTMNNIKIDTPYINVDGDSIYNVRKIIDIPFWYHSFVCSFLIIMGVLGVSLNGFVIWNFFFQRVTPSNLVLINLAVVEFLIAFVGVPMDVLPLLDNEWIPGQNWCVATGTVVTTSGFISMMTLTVLSICRMAAFYPIHGIDGKISSFKESLKIISATWLYSFILSLPPLFGWGKYVPELSGLGCTPDWHSKSSSLTYTLWIMILGFVIPTIIIITSSIVTFAKIFELRHSILSDEVRRASFKRDKRAFKLILSMSFAYLICWCPYAVLSFIHIFISNSVIGPMMSMVPTITVKISVVINPILYIGYNSQFIDVFTPCFQCCGNPILKSILNMIRLKELKKEIGKSSRKKKKSDSNFQRCSDTSESEPCDTSTKTDGHQNDRLGTKMTSFSSSSIDKSETKRDLKVHFDVKQKKRKNLAPYISSVEPSHDSTTQYDNDLLIPCSKSPCVNRKSYKKNDNLKYRQAQITFSTKDEEYSLRTLSMENTPAENKSTKMTFSKLTSNLKLDSTENSPVQNDAFEAQPKKPSNKYREEEKDEVEKYRAPLAVSESLSTIHEHPIDNRNIGGQILNHERVTPSSLEQVNQVAKDEKFKIQLSNTKSNEIENLNDGVNFEIQSQIAKFTKSSKIQSQIAEFTKSSDSTKNRYLKRTNSKKRSFNETEL